MQHHIKAEPQHDIMAKTTPNMPREPVSKEESEVVAMVANMTEQAEAEIVKGCGLYSGPF